MTELGFDFDFRPRPTTGPLAPVVDQTWFARGTVSYRRELIAPTGSTVAVLVFGDPIRASTSTGATVTSADGLLVGPHTAPVLNEPLGETFAVGVITRPVGCAAVFGAAPGRWRGRVAELAEAAPAWGGIRDDLAASASDGADPDDLLDRLDAHLARVVDLDRDGEARTRVADALAELERDPRRPIRAVAADVGVSHEHLDREFGRIVGLTPRALARLLLLRRLVAELDPLAQVSWVEIAIEGGWSDQAHFSRDFKRHTGLAPTRYLEVQRAFAEAGNEGRGFSPDIDDLR